MLESPHFNAGKLEIYTGPMRSGKIRELLSVSEKFARLLKENSIDFKIKLSKDFKNIGESVKYNRPLRVEMISLFSYLEVLLCLNITYKKKISDKGKIIKWAMENDTIIEFYNNYCLSDENK